jgi:hypothetical protein
MVAGSLPQLANVLTIRELQNYKRRTRTNSSAIKKLTYLFGEPLANAKAPFFHFTLNQDRVICLRS